MKPSQIVLYIPDVAALLGKTEAATTSAHRRGQIPGAFKLLGRVAWRRDELEAWLAGQAAKPEEAGETAGRPRKGRKRRGHDVDITPASPPAPRRSGGCSA